MDLLSLRSGLQNHLETLHKNISFSYIHLTLKIKIGKFDVSISEKMIDSVHIFTNYDI